jgi:hypothetical protein
VVELIGQETAITPPVAGYAESRQATDEAIAALRDTLGGESDASLAHGDSTEWFLRAAEHGAVGELMPDVLLYRRLHHTNRIRRLAGASRNEFLQIIKKSLDRRRRLDRND